MMAKKQQQSDFSTAWWVHPDKLEVQQITMKGEPGEPACKTQLEAEIKLSEMLADEIAQHREALKSLKLKVAENNARMYELRAAEGSIPRKGDDVWYYHDGAPTMSPVYEVKWVPKLNRFRIAVGLKNYPAWKNPDEIWLSRDSIHKDYKQRKLKQLKQQKEKLERKLKELEETDAERL